MTVFGGLTPVITAVVAALACFMAIKPMYEEPGPHGRAIKVDSHAALLKHSEEFQKQASCNAECLSAAAPTGG